MTLLQDVKALQLDVAVLEKETDEQRSRIGAHEEQLNGKRGVQATLDGVIEEIGRLRRAAYWVAGSFLVGTITFAVSVLRVFGH